VDFRYDSPRLPVNFDALTSSIGQGDP